MRIDEITEARTDEVIPAIAAAGAAAVRGAARSRWSSSSRRS